MFYSFKLYAEFNALVHNLAARLMLVLLNLIRKPMIGHAIYHVVTLKIYQVYFESGGHKEWFNDGL